MTTRAKSLFLLVLLIGWFLFWLLYFPFRPETLLRAVPDESWFVSSHDHPAEHWDDLKRNPLMASLFESTGLIEEGPDGVTVETEAAEWVQRIGQRRLVLAHSRADRYSGVDAWYFAGWLGYRSTLYRWLFTIAPPRGVKKLTSAHGDIVWRVDAGSNSEPLSIAFMEGLVVGAFSRDPGAVRRMVDAFHEGDADTDEQPHKVWLATRGGAPDRCWMQTTKGHSPGGVGVSFDRLAADRTVARVEWIGKGFDLDGLPPRAVSGIPDPLLRAGRPLAYGRFATDWAVALLDPFSGQAWADGLTEWLVRYPDRRVDVALYDGDFSGSFMHFRTPGLALALPTDHEESAREHMTELLDRLNAEYRLGLIPGQMVEDDRVLYRLEAVSGGVYARLDPNERAAFYPTDERCYVAASFKTLKRLLAADAAARAPTDVEPGRPVWLTVDLERIGSASRVLMAAISFRMLLEDAEATRDKRESLKEAQAWIDALIPLKTGTVSIDTDSDRPVLHIRLGPTEDAL